MTTEDYLRLTYRDKFRSLYNDSFQSWFEELARLMHPTGDFQAIRKTQGDGGFDGYVINSQLVYQVYAPATTKELQDSKTAAKIRADFTTAYSNLDAELKFWVFVHNHPEAELGKLSIKALSKLKSQYHHVNITVLNINSLWESLTEKVSLDVIARVLNVENRQINAASFSPAIIERFILITNRDSEEKRICGMSKPLERSEIGYVEDLLEAGKPVLVTGEAGVGKSGVAYALCSPRADANLPVIYLDVRVYNSILCINDLSHMLELPGSFTESIRQVAQNGGCRLIIDQLDSAATEASGNTFILLAKEVCQKANVQVVVLSRQQEGYERELLKPLIDIGFEQIPCNQLMYSDSKSILKTVGVASPTDDLIELCRNLLNLDIVARTRQNYPLWDFSLISSEFDLWDGYVQALSKVERQSPQGLTFGDQIIAEATKLAYAGLSAEEKVFQLIPPLNPAQSRLKSWSVIVPYEGYSYRFQHEKFRDFLYVRDAVGRGIMPADVLNEVHGYRVHSILLGMNTMYPRIRPSTYAKFLREFLNG